MVYYFGTTKQYGTPYTTIHKRHAYMYIEIGDGKFYR